MLYKSECCSNCGAHPTQHMLLHLDEFICAVCKTETKKLVPTAKEPVDDEDL